MHNNSSEEEDKNLIVFLYIINVISIITCIILMVTYIPNKTKHSFPLDIVMFLLTSCVILSLVSFIFQIMVMNQIFVLFKLILFHLLQ